jgi:hypothetical protein
MSTMQLVYEKWEGVVGQCEMERSVVTARLGQAELS